VLFDATPPLAKGNRLNEASGRSPDLARWPRRSRSDMEIGAVKSVDFESVTVAGPCGNLTRFPILPGLAGHPKQVLVWKRT
jgi:hypothetical protein